MPRRDLSSEFWLPYDVLSRALTFDSLLLQRDGVRACRYKIILAAATNDKRCVFTLAATVFTRGRSCPKGSERIGL